mmetsp:Transcript_9914/g.22540  ORF Transcript_9914/g.22540 Transcript_9914/m.22540 type:complete len:508 (-) Transcript_9914:78-1601(-)
MATVVSHGGSITSTVLSLNRVLLCSTDDVEPTTYSTCSLITANNVTLSEGPRFPTELKDHIGLARLSSSRAVLCNGGSGIRGACSVLTTVGNSLSVGSTLRFEQRLSVKDVSIAYLQQDAVALCYITLDAQSETVLLCAKLVAESFGLDYGTEITVWNRGTNPPSMVQLAQLDLNKVMACYAGGLMGLTCNVLQASGMTLARGTALQVTEDPVQLMAITPIDVDQATVCYVAGDRSILTGTVSTELYCALVSSASVSTSLSMRKAVKITKTQSANAYNSIAVAAADVYEAVLCAVMVSPTVRGVCNHLTITPQGQFYSGPDKEFFTAATSTLDLARLGTQRTSMCMKRPQSFSNCTVLYNLPKYQSPINSTGIIGRIVHRGFTAWWIPVVVVSIVVGLCVIGGVAFYFLSDRSGMNEKAQELVKRKRKKGAAESGEYEPVSTESRSEGPPTASAPRAEWQPGSGQSSGRVAAGYPSPPRGQYPTSYQQTSRSQPGSYSGGRQYVMQG